MTLISPYSRSQNLAPTFGNVIFFYKVRCQFEKFQGNMKNSRERWRKQKAFAFLVAPSHSTYILLPVSKHFYIGRVIKNIVPEQTRH